MKLPDELLISHKPPVAPCFSISKEYFNYLRDKYFNKEVFEAEKLIYNYNKSIAHTREMVNRSYKKNVLFTTLSRFTLVKLDIKRHKYVKDNTIHKLIDTIDSAIDQSLDQINQSEQEIGEFIFKQ